jgi:hypothetical protein
MGWSFACRDIGRAAHIAELTSKTHFSAGYTPLEHRVVGNRIWQLVRIESTGRLLITLDLIAKDRKGGWGYKGMSEDMGPSYYNCPLSLLEKASEPPEPGYAAEWRKKVREHHAKRKENEVRTWETGMCIRYGSHEYRLHSPAGPRRGWHVVRCGDGANFRMRANQLVQAEIVGSEA